MIQTGKSIQYLRCVLLLLLWVVSGSFEFPVKQQVEAIRPNIILILADDMGYSDLGCMGSEIKTPHLDTLAKNGLLMTQFYNAGRCCPSRASLLTGLYQHQAGVGDMDQNRGYSSYQGYLNDQCLTIAEVLKTAGYVTAMTGKWHLGNEPENWPQRRGFDNFYGIPKGGGTYFYPFLVDRQVWKNNEQVTPDADFYSTDAFNGYAADFIAAQKNNKQPFFLYLAHIAPHFPLQARAEDIARYRGKYKAGFAAIRNQRFQRQQKSGVIGNTVRLSPGDQMVKDWSQLSEAQKDTFDLKMAVYAAQIECMDRGIGKMIQQLKEAGKYENTLILFLSDNGGTSENPVKMKGASGTIGSAGSWDAYGASWANISNTPFRLYKQWVHEGGIATPLIVHYPRLIKKGRIDDQPGHIIDIMPTLLELSGASYPQTYNGKLILPLAGNSLLPIFRGKNQKPHEALFWEHEGNRAVRQGNWKLVSSYPGNQWELYDLSVDPTELNDVSSKYVEKVKALGQEYERWAESVGVQPWDKLNAKRK